jgi:hypothetical protein
MIGVVVTVRVVDLIIIFLSSSLVFFPPARSPCRTFFTIPHAIFHCLEGRELSVAMLPDQELARATKKAIKEESCRFTAFQNLPRLCSAIITIENGIHSLAFRLPWSQLSKLDMIKTIIHPHIFLDVLSSSAPSLKDGFDPTLDIRMRSLCYLRIDLVQDRRKTGWVVSIYQKLLSKSSNTLESLTFWDASFWDVGTMSQGLPLWFIALCKTSTDFSRSSQSSSIFTSQLDLE